MSVCRDQLAFLHKMPAEFTSADLPYARVELAPVVHMRPRPQGQVTQRDGLEVLSFQLPAHRQSSARWRTQRHR